MKLDIMLKEVGNAVRDAGAFLMGEYNNFDRNRVELKRPGDLVSYVDRESELLLKSKLSDICPEAGFIAEESFEGRIKEGLNWVIDPLDGTTNFVHKIPSFGVSVALMHFDAILLGIVYNPAVSEVFEASQGAPSLLNGRPICVSRCYRKEDALFGTGLPVTNFDRLPDMLQTIDVLARNSRGVRRLGAASIDLCYVACGRLDAFFECNLSPWDVAAGALIVQQAGGIVSDFSGGRNFIFGREIVAAGASLYPEFLSILKDKFGV